MKERGITFNDWGVRQIQEDLKRMTRRPFTENDARLLDFLAGATDDDGTPMPGTTEALVQEVHGSSLRVWSAEYPEEGYETLVCPYGVPGDRLYVRETWRIWECASFSATGERLCPDVLTGSLRGLSLDYLRSRPLEHRAMTLNDGPWRAAMHMPRWAARTFLEVTSVRVERVQDITEADAIAEGFTVDSNGHVPRADGVAWGSARTAFAELWDSIYGPGAWERNDWVWVIGFRRLGT